MKFNLGIIPPPIKVTVGAESFELQHNYLTGTERTQVLEAMVQGLSLPTQLLWDKIFAWSGVTDENGQPIAFESLDAEGRKRRKLDEIMGRIPLLAQLKAYLVQLAMNGIRHQNGHGLLMAAEDDAGQVDAIMKEIDGFFGTASGAAGKPSA